MTRSDSLPPERILAAAREVFAHSGYRDAPGILDRFRLPSLDIDPRLAALILGFVLATFAAIVVARLLVHRDWKGGGRRLVGRRGAPAHDPWVAVRELAAAGRWGDAAHALYRAVIHGLGRDGLVDPHPAKTGGDYAREIRARDPERHESFRRFTTRWERAVYGTVPMDGATLDELRADAVALGERR